MEVHLESSQVELLARILKNYLGDLRMEIRDTDSYGFRQELKEDENAIRQLLELLEPATSRG